jgi:hypothetical protein
LLLNPAAKQLFVASGLGLFEREQWRRLLRRKKEDAGNPELRRETQARRMLRKYRKFDVQLEQKEQWARLRRFRKDQRKHLAKTETRTSGPVP